VAAHPTEVDQAVATEWLRYSLRQGEVISPDALKVVEERPGRSFTLAPENVDAALLANPHNGGVVRRRAADEALTEVLDALAARGAACVVVEDEMRLRRDPSPFVAGVSGGYVGERLLHWSRLADGSTAALDAINVSHDYPLNAFVTSASEEMLDLVHGADLPSGIGTAVAASLVAVIVGAYDAETFIVWERSES
jgi:hypothetical protein